MGDLEPITRNEKLWSGEDLTPVTRREMYIKHLYDETQVIPEYHVTREEMFILKAGEELHDVTIEQLTATENKIYSEEGVAYSPVIVNVPQTTLTTLDVTENGTYTAPSGTAYSEVDVDVPLPENAYLLKEIEDVEIASFNDGSDLPMPKLEVAIEPVQEGSGDPSPENIRPISGWDEVNVGVAGKNLFDKTATDTNKGFISGKWINQTGNTFSYGDWSVSEYIRVDGEKIAVSGMTVAEQISSGRGGYCCYDKYKNVLGGGTYNALTQIITLPTNTEYIRISVWNQNKDVCQLELSETATAYEPYNGNTYTIDLDGTRYGGKVDLVSGVMTVDKGYVDLGTLDWGVSNNHCFYSENISDLKIIDSASVVPNLMCSHYPTKTPSNAYNGYSGDCISQGISGIIGEKKLLIYDRNYSDATAFKTAMSGVKIVYELATPLTIQLPTTVVKSLRGRNNVFADTGNILDLSYLAKEE